MENVLQKLDPADRKFGLLGCDHCFCLPCIRGWRNNSFADVESATRTCPICRVPAFFVTPATVWPQTDVRPRFFCFDGLIGDFYLRLVQHRLLREWSAGGMC
jgi:hypothetical protein